MTRIAERALEDDDAPLRRQRLSRRRQDKRARGRFLRYTALGTLIPGVGLIAAGRRRSGNLVLTLFLVGCLGALFVAFTLIRQGRTGLLEFGLDSSNLSKLGWGLAALAVVWFIVALVSHRALEPPDATTGTRLLGALVVIVAASLVVTPLTMGSRYAFSSRAIVELFPSADEGVSLTRPDDVSKADPWADRPRVNVLLLGSDAGPDREGIRPDTIILASIDTQSGATTLFSIPRSLQEVPFPDVEGPAGELHDAYPRGYRANGDEGEQLINAIYRNVPDAHPEVFQGVADPGAEAMKLAVQGVTGVPVDYYVMINLQGFEEMVNAVGGVVVDVPYRIPVGNKTLSSGACSRATGGYIEPGPNQQLNGVQALWFARARCIPDEPRASSDYERMLRQRCVINAVVDRINPATVLTRYAQIASATTGLIQTDIPQDLLAAFTDLALRVQSAGLRSVAFTADSDSGALINTVDPDYDAIHAIVQAALAPPPPATSTQPGSGGTTPAPGTSQPTTTSPSGGTTTPANGTPQDLTQVC